MRQLPFILTLLALSVSGCEEKLKPPVVAGTTSDIPSQESWRSTITFSDSARIKAVLWAGYIARHAQEQYTLLKDSVQVDFFNEEQQHTSRLTARWGRVNDRTQDFVAYDHVVVKSDSGTVLLTDSLFWDNAARRIHTAAFVDITSPTEHIVGRGMESDQNLRNYRIFRVTGEAVTND